MTIDEAIRVLTLKANIAWDKGNETDADALRLGIQALRRCKILAEVSSLWAAHPLPGETEE